MHMFPQIAFQMTSSLMKMYMLVDQGNMTDRATNPNLVNLVFYLTHEADIHNIRCHAILHGEFYEYGKM